IRRLEVELAVGANDLHRIPLAVFWTISHPLSRVRKVPWRRLGPSVGRGVGGIGPGLAAAPTAAASTSAGRTRGAAGPALAGGSSTTARTTARLGGFRCRFANRDV